MTEKPDPLWDPALPGDESLKRLESLLSGYRHVPPAKLSWPNPRRARWQRITLAAAATLVACAVGIAAWLPWRLQWSEARHWAIETNAPQLPEALEVGQTLIIPANQSAVVRIARIGSMQLAPGARIKLSDTRSGHHRLELLEGTLRARIWAPPGYFGITTGASETIDLGCEFEMQRDAQGTGSIHVTSGWVMHAVNGQETLVPAGSTLRFDAERSGIPFAITATTEFRNAVDQLDLSMARGKRAPAVEARIANDAAVTDRFTLLTLLTRYPTLASGPLYPRLANEFGEIPLDPKHRSAWQQGSVHAMNQWWEQMPRPPKAWWLNWRDAVG